MPYHVHTRTGAGALGVIVETAREALVKAAAFLKEGHREVTFKDLLGNVLDRAVVVTMAEIED
jgi:hypothetical protein